MRAPHADDPRRLPAAVRPRPGQRDPRDRAAAPGRARRGRQVAAYAKVCGFALREHVPITYPHVLAFPLHMAVMADGRFPFGAVGLVHIENRIRQHRPIAIGEQITIRVPSGAWRPTRAAGPSRWSPRSTRTASRSGRASARCCAAARARRQRRRTGGARGRGSAGRADARRRSAAERHMAAAGRPRPSLRRGLGRPQPDSHASAQREAARLSRRDRARHVEQGALPGGARESPAGRCGGAGRFRKPILLPAKVQFASSLSQAPADVAPVRSASRSATRGRHAPSRWRVRRLEQTKGARRSERPKVIAERSMGLGLRALGALAGSPALDKLGVRKQTEKLIYRATKNGFKAATAASRTFKIARRLPGPARQGAAKAPVAVRHHPRRRAADAPGGRQRLRRREAAPGRRAGRRGRGQPRGAARRRRASSG